MLIIGILIASASELLYFPSGILSTITPTHDRDALQSSVSRGPSPELSTFLVVRLPPHRLVLALLTRRGHCCT